MALTGAPRPSVIDEIVDRIIKSIENGELSPGSQLPSEPDLAQMLGVGRTTLREALGRLRALGVVEVQRGRGTFVSTSPMRDPRVAFTQWTEEHHDQVLGLFEVRMALEAGAASLAAVRGTADDLAALRQAAIDHIAAGGRADIDQLVDSDQRFHRALITAAHNEALERMYALLVGQLVEYRRKSLALEGASNRSGTDHLNICDAIESRHPDVAREAVLTHLASLYNEVLEARGSADGEGPMSVPRI